MHIIYTLVLLQKLGGFGYGMSTPKSGTSSESVKVINHNYDDDYECDLRDK